MLDNKQSLMGDNVRSGLQTRIARQLFGGRCVDAGGEDYGSTLETLVAHFSRKITKTAASLALYPIRRS